jgi:hypothetical protein
MSEPLFLAILASVLLALTDFLASGRRRSLWFAAAGTAAAVLTRYAAGWLVILGVAAILLVRTASWKERVGDALRFGLGASVPVALWLVRNVVLAGSATNRILRWHPITIDDLRSFLQIVTAWFTAARYSHWLEGAVLLGLLVAAAAYLWRRRKTEAGEANQAAILGMLLVGVAATYPAYIALSRSLFDDSIPIDDRMFAPTFVALVALTGVVAALLGRGRRGAWILLPLAGLFLIGLVPYMAGRFRSKYESMRQDGILFASRAWRGSESMAWVSSLPQDALVYSNQALVIQFLAGRPAYQIPERFDSVKAEERSGFEGQLEQMQSDLQRPGSYLLVFDAGLPVTPDDLPNRFKEGLVVVRLMRDGFVMASDAAGWAP